MTDDGIALNSTSHPTPKGWRRAVSCLRSFRAPRISKSAIVNAWVSIRDSEELPGAWGINNTIKRWDRERFAGNLQDDAAQRSAGARHAEDAAQARRTAAAALREAGTHEPRASDFGEISPWRPMADPVALKHLGKLGEECNELGSAASRCIIQGIDEAQPVTGKPNRLWLEEEVADVLANIELCIEHFALDCSAIAARKVRKMQGLRRWHAQA